MPTKALNVETQLVDYLSKRITHLPLEEIHIRKPSKIILESNMK